MAFAIGRFRKVKQQDNSKTGAMLNHNTREELSENVDKTLVHLNRFLIGPKTTAEIKSCLKTRWQELELAAKRKTRSDAVGSIEVMLSASPDFFDAEKYSPPGPKFDGWVQANIDFLVAEYGRENVISVILHLDEKTPHFHAVVVPVVDGKLNAKAKVGNMVAMSQYQSRYALAMTKFGLERGQCTITEDPAEQVAFKSKPKHEPPKKYYERLENSNRRRIVLMYAEENKELEKKLALHEDFLKTFKIVKFFKTWLREKTHSKHTQIALGTIFPNFVVKTIRNILN